MARSTRDVCRKYIDAARDHRKEGAFEQAGDYYTLAAYWWLFEGEFRSDDAFGHALAELLHAVTAYCLAGTTGRCQNRAKQGVLIAEDARESVFDHDAFRGLAHEYAGDFRVLADLDDAEAAYERALDYYEPLESDLREADVIGWANREAAFLNSTFLIELAGAVGIEIDEETIAEIRSRSFVSRVEFKRKHLGAFVERLEEQGEWPPASDD